MPNSRSTTGLQDAQPFYMDENYEVTYSTKTVGVTPDQLREAQLDEIV